MTSYSWIGYVLPTEREASFVKKCVETRVMEEKCKHVTKISEEHPYCSTCGKRCYYEKEITYNIKAINEKKFKDVEPFERNVCAWRIEAGNIVVWRLGYSNGVFIGHKQCLLVGSGDDDYIVSVPYPSKTIISELRQFALDMGITECLRMYMY